MHGIELIPFELFRAHPLRDNVCVQDIQEKIKANFQRTGQMEPVSGYRDPEYPDQITLLNGHVRWQIAKELGLTHLECKIWDISPAEAQVVLATLKNLHGTSDPCKRSILMESLVQHFPIEDLVLLLPESKAEIEDLLALRDFDVDAQEEAFWAQVEAEKKELPLPLTFMVSGDGEAIILKALEPYLTTAADRGDALVQLCQKHLALTQEDGLDESP